MGARSPSELTPSVRTQDQLLVHYETPMHYPVAGYRDNLSPTRMQPIRSQQTPSKSSSQKKRALKQKQEEERLQLSLKLAREGDVIRKLDFSKRKSIELDLTSPAETKTKSISPKKRAHSEVLDLSEQKEIKESTGVTERDPKRGKPDTNSETGSKLSPIEL